MTDAKKKAIGPLSHSSASTLLECEQRYAYYKIDGVPQDTDYVKSDALAIGSAFHKVLEDSRHEKPESIRVALLKCVEDPEVRLPEDEILLVHAMLLKYLRLHKQMGFKILAIEIAIETKEVIGYVDAIMEDHDGKWWIVDLKAKKSLSPTEIAMLPTDPQLNLYAAHAAMIAEQLGLDMQKFGGCRWRVVTKTTAKQKRGETDAEYVARLANENIKAYDIPVPFNEEAAAERLETHLDLYKRTQKLAKSKPIKNFKSCNSFFSPCAYWSRCYGKNYSDSLDTSHLTVLGDEG